ncbi:hypothetical protein BJX76DRAFT_172534 [Aspergillus varians]
MKREKGKAKGGLYRDHVCSRSAQRPRNGGEGAENSDRGVYSQPKRREWDFRIRQRKPPGSGRLESLMVRPESGHDWIWIWLLFVTFVGAGAGNTQKFPGIFVTTTLSLPW